MPDIWTDDSKLRRKKFGSIIAGSDIKDIAQLARSIFRKKCERRSKGKLMYSYEENQLKAGLKALSGEIAFALGISPVQAEKLLEFKFSE